MFVLWFNIYWHSISKRTQFDKGNWSEKLMCFKYRLQYLIQTVPLKTVRVTFKKAQNELQTTNQKSLKKYIYINMKMSPSSFTDILKYA